MNKNIMTDNTNCETRSSIKLGLYLFALFFVSYESIVYLANDMIMPGMLQVTAQFNVGLEYVASSLSLFLLGSTIIQLFLGPAADRFGKRRIILIGNCLFLIFTILIAISSNIQEFMLGRLLQGSGCAFVAIGYAVVHENFNDRDAVRLIAIMGNITILAPLLGPVVGGVIINYYDWRAVFIIVALVSLVTFTGLAKFTPKSNVTHKKIRISNVFLEYYSILKNKKFIFGTTAVSLALIPMIAWIGLAPVLTMKTAGLSFSMYLICQAIALSGLATACVVIQFIAGKLSFFSIMAISTALFFLGFLLSVFFTNSIIFISINFFISTFGLGLYNGMAIRSIITSGKFSKNMTMSLFVFFESIAMAGGIELVNVVCTIYNFSLKSFTITNFLLSIVTVFFMISFALMNQERGWN